MRPALWLPIALAVWWGVTPAHAPPSTTHGLVTQLALQEAVAELCSNPRIDGLLVQLPLPPHIDEEAVIESFEPAKDVDGFHPLNLGSVLSLGWGLGGHMAWLAGWGALGLGWVGLGRPGVAPRVAQRSQSARGARGAAGCCASGGPKKPVS